MSSMHPTFCTAIVLFMGACTAPGEEVREELDGDSSDPSEASAPRVDSGERTGGIHKRPIIDHEGRRLLWARDDEDGNQDWFDVTDAEIDPEKFQFGIGKDTIPSIDDPVFCEYDDPRLETAGIDLETQVLGVAIGSEARAYPVDAMSRHEVVNDRFGGEAYAILW